MPVQSISLNNVAFRGETSKTEAAPKTESKAAEENKNIDGKKIGIALGGLALAGLTAVLIGKSRKVPSELNIEEFKKIGSFENGLAVAKKKPFSGIINVANKSGNYSLEYDKGVLKQSTKFREIALSELEQQEPQVTAVSKKVYSIGDNGEKNIDIFRHNNGINIFGGKEWARIKNTQVQADKTKVITETPMGITMISRRVTEKNPDGTWNKYLESNVKPDDWHKN